MVNSAWVCQCLAPILIRAKVPGRSQTSSSSSGRAITCWTGISNLSDALSKFHRNWLQFGGVQGILGKFRLEFPHQPNLPSEHPVLLSCTIFTMTSMISLGSHSDRTRITSTILMNLSAHTVVPPS